MNARIDVPKMAGLSELCSLFEDGSIKLVGGAVRDALLGDEPHDVDLATTMTPAEVDATCRAAGLTTIPTGIDHGTLTVIVAGGPIEITTLRRDVATDGRRATVAFTKDWAEDAERRDFTVNALFADPKTGRILDTVGGVNDLCHKRLRFVGDADTRIAEDALRIMRLFRFSAKLGAIPDDAAYLACRKAAGSVSSLSGERIAQEMVKLLSIPNVMPAMRAMAEAGVLQAALPYGSSESIKDLQNLVVREEVYGVVHDPIRRMASLMLNVEAVSATAAQLKMSTADRLRMEAACGSVSTNHRADVYYEGFQAFRDRVLIGRKAPDVHPRDLGRLSMWEVPVLPVKGGQLIEAGVPKGPLVTKALQALERDWVEAGFPTGKWVEDRTAMAKNMLHEIGGNPRLHQQMQGNMQAFAYQSR